MGQHGHAVLGDKHTSGEQRDDGDDDGRRAVCDSGTSAPSATAHSDRSHSSRTVAEASGQRWPASVDDSRDHTVTAA